MTSGLQQLSERVAEELELLDYPRKEWMPQRTTASGAHIYDVIVVGGGQGGLATAFGLRRQRIRNVLVLDENPLGRAGPWLNFARMHTLRTPKHVLGPDLGIPSLTPRAYFEARHGQGSWQALSKLAKEDWAAYLEWLRATLDLPVQADTRVGVLRYCEQERAFMVPCSRLRGVGSDQVLFARRVVLATGIAGSGAWHVPSLIRDALPPSAYAHTSDDIDFAALRGRRVAVLGAGASAFDNAAVALEHGAAEVRLFFRRPALVTVNAYRWAEFSGFLGHFAELSPADRYRFVRQLLRMGQLPPADTYRRATQYSNFYLHPGSAWERIEQQQSGDPIVIEAAGQRFTTDFVIAATGFITDLRQRPELAEFEPHIARWHDRYQPEPQEQHPDLERHPYLGPHFEFTERVQGAAPYLQHVFNYTFGGLLSLGFGGASISGMKYSCARLVSGLTRSFFVEDRELHFASLRAYCEEEFET